MYKSVKRPFSSEQANSLSPGKPVSDFSGERGFAMQAAGA
ncbi:hypothetical protein SD77_4135 [Bacillus badius]|uniref:Ribose 5-phosphate isomerase B n=1 Tax=Bacillus badius TaxID=1455 RepID=A0ABR5AUN9_BACBA|nr:hypothetical protein SD78_0439 [Bacillus badius]KIL78455.1 hypothetical protein SD77_4135 [Bacillus badius]